MLVAFASVKGAPGVTTSARVLASVWPEDVVLADCDPAGGDLALTSRATDGGPLDPDTGLLSLAAQARRGLGPDGVADHLQTIEGGLRVLSGVSGPEQVHGFGPVWPTIGAALAGLQGTDVLADCGRLAPSTPVLPVVAAADALVLVVRPRLVELAHLRERLRWLAGVHETTMPMPPVGVVVADARDRDVIRGLRRMLLRAGLDVPVLGHLADDRRAAEVLGGEVNRGISRSILVRSARELVAPIRARAEGKGAVAGA